MNEAERKHRAFICLFLGEVLRQLSDLPEEEQIEVLRIALRERDGLEAAQFVARQGLKYFRNGGGEIVPIAFASGFIPPDVVAELIADSKTPDQPLPKKIRQGYIYIAKNKRNGLVKIGFSTVPHHREKTLQSEEPEIKFEVIFEGTSGDEKSIHDGYANRRIRGEWFKLSDSDIESIKTVWGGRNSQ